MSRLSAGSRHSEVAGDIPAHASAPFPSDTACKNGHYSIPNRGKIKLKTKRRACVRVEKALQKV